MNLTTGNNIVDSIGRIDISGNVIPMSWYKTIVRETGKPHLEAIVILSDIVYWYRPTEIRDETSGELIGYKKKFKSDLLQRSYQQLANMFGISKREATNAIVRLEKLGVINRVFRTLNINDIVTSNVLFLELIPERLAELTFGTESIKTAEPSEKGIGITFKSDRGNFQKGEVYTRSGGTYTENTTKITTKTTSYEEKIEKEKVREDKKANHKKEEPEKNAPTSQEIVDAYNETCVSLPRVAKITDKRKKALKKISSKFSIGDIRTVFKKAQESSFLNGSTDKWSGATFDWLVKEDNIVKVLEGNYDDKNAKRKKHPNRSYNLDEFQNYSIFDDE